MKSPHTLIKLHERAIRMQEMISYCERYEFSHLIDYANKNFDYNSQFHLTQANRYELIKEYLQKRYDNLLNNLK